MAHLNLNPCHFCMVLQISIHYRISNETQKHSHTKVYITCHHRFHMLHYYDLCSKEERQKQDTNSWNNSFMKCLGIYYTDGIKNNIREHTFVIRGKWNSYRQKWTEHLNKTQCERLLKSTLDYHPQVRRDIPDHTNTGLKLEQACKPILVKIEE